MSKNDVTNVVFAGLGGQGVLKASDIMADVAFEAGFDVKKSEIHGMSQRGGSVTSDVRFGAEVASPMVPVGRVHYLVVLAPDQVDNNRGALRPDGVLIEPNMIDSDRLPHQRSINVALLGLLSKHLDISEEQWLKAIRNNLPEKLHQMNEKAFALGRKAGTA